MCVQHIFKSGNIWSVNASQPPFKVEISPRVTVLLRFIGVCLFFSNFHGYFIVLKLDFIFPMWFWLTTWKTCFIF